MKLQTQIAINPERNQIKATGFGLFSINERLTGIGGNMAEIMLYIQTL